MLYLQSQKLLSKNYIDCNLNATNAKYWKDYFPKSNTLPKLDKI